MDIKSILVVVAAVGENAPLKLALALSKRHAANVAVLHVMPMPIIVYGGMGGEMPVSVIEAQQREAEQVAANVEKDVKALAAQAGFEIEWRSEQGDQIGTASIHARYSDLTIATPEVARDLVFGSAAPVIAVPASAKTNPPRRALIAWNGSREAARAVHDALPMLRAAESVDVVIIDPPAGEAIGIDLARTLGRHGIKVELRERLSQGAEAGSMLLEEARTSGADLLVMGAYGHSRFREWVLGGATEEALNEGKIPVLLSH